MKTEIKNRAIALNTTSLQMEVTTIIDNKVAEISKVEIPLKEISAENLIDYRRKKNPFIVLKQEDKLYYVEVPKKIEISSLRNNHRCCKKERICNRLSAATDKNGGCQKVRNRARFIERYPWITSGYETFGLKPNNVFVVNACEHYEKCLPPM